MPVHAWDAAATLLLVLTVGGYLAGFRRAQRSADDAVSPVAHAQLRQDWFDAVADQPGAEVLAVQTLRNSLMSASATASTALLALMGTVSLMVPSLRGAFGPSAPPDPWAQWPGLVTELILVLLMLSSLLASTMALRDYHHASFVGGIPAGAPARARWQGLGRESVRRAGVLYGLALRLLMLAAPAAVAVLVPWAGVVVTVCVVAVLRRFDRTGTH